MRTLAAALALTLLAPAAVLAQDASDPPTWPTADELRLDLQGIGYRFEYDPMTRAVAPEFRTDLPGVWSLTEPSIVEPDMPDDISLEPFALWLVDIDGQPAQVAFSAASIDDGDGELEAMTTVLMEVAARLPAGNGLDAAAWYMSNLWLPPEMGERTTLPCLVTEFDGGATVVWPGGDGERLTSLFGTLVHFDGVNDEVEQCKALQAQAGVADVGSADAAAAAAVGTGDYTVTPSEAVELIDAGGYTIIDVRTAAEYEQAHVVGAVNIDVEAPDFADRIAELDPDQAYLLYCRSGRRSALAADQMAGAGFTDLADAGGLADLARAGAPVE